MKPLAREALLKILLILLFSCSDKNELVFNNVFSENGSLATIVTGEIINISGTSAEINGSMIHDGDAYVAAYGVCWSKAVNPTIKSDLAIVEDKKGDFSIELKNLEPGTNYYIKTFVINSVGTNYGEEKSFTTHNTPTINSNPIISFSGTTAVVGGNIISDNGEDIIEKGIYFGSDMQPELTGTKMEIKMDSSIYDTIITGLTLDSRYFVKAYAVNSVGVSYGEEITFLTEPQDTINDIDGNSYSWFKIGSQIWMKQNLKTTKYCDGSSIPNITENTIWGSLSTGAYCWFNNDLNNKDQFGALYNFYTVIDYRNLCPQNWHIPTNDEWRELINYFGGFSIAGMYLREGDFKISGYRQYYGEFDAYMGFWWSSSGFYGDGAWYIGIWYDERNDIYMIDRRSMKEGYSIRCIRDK